MSAEWFPNAVLHGWGRPVLTPQLRLLHRLLYRPKYVSHVTPMLVERAFGKVFADTDTIQVTEKIKTVDESVWFFGALINHTCHSEAIVSEQKAMILFPYPYDFHIRDRCMSVRHMALYVTGDHNDLWLWEQKIMCLTGSLILEMEAEKGKIVLPKGGGYEVDWADDDLE